MQHLTVRANGAAFHVATTGTGPPLLLLHGWPEFWLMRMLKGEAVRLPPIDLPTCVRWAEHDPLFPYAWTDRLGESFSNLDLAMLEGVGHFAHREDPARAAADIAGFFERIGWV